MTCFLPGPALLPKRLLSSQYVGISTVKPAVLTLVEWLHWNQQGSSNFLETRDKETFWLWQIRGNVVFTYLENFQFYYKWYPVNTCVSLQWLCISWRVVSESMDAGASITTVIVENERICNSHEYLYLNFFQQQILFSFLWLNWTWLLLLYGWKGSGGAAKLGCCCQTDTGECHDLAMNPKQLHEKKCGGGGDIQGHNLLAYQWKLQFRVWIIHCAHCVKISSF